jgi:hypothetical protein
VGVLFYIVMKANYGNSLNLFSGTKAVKKSIPVFKLIFSKKYSVNKMKSNFAEDF